MREHPLSTQGQPGLRRSGTDGWVPHLLIRPMPILQGPFLANTSGPGDSGWGGTPRVLSRRLVTEALFPEALVEPGPCHQPGDLGDHMDHPPWPALAAPRPLPLKFGLPDPSG